MNPGLSPEVQAALQRRMGQSTPQLNQVSSGAQMANMVPEAMPESQMTATSMPPAQSATPSQKYQPQNQDDMIIQALIEHLKSSGQLKKEQLKAQAPMM